MKPPAPEELKRILAQIKLKEETAKALREEISDLYSTIAERYVTAKVGDVVKSKGYAFQNKLCRINNIECGPPFWRHESYTTRIKAIVLKKNGEESQQHTDWREEQEFEL